MFDPWAVVLPAVPSGGRDPPADGVRTGEGVPAGAGDSTSNSRRALDSPRSASRTKTECDHAHLHGRTPLSTCR